MPIPVEVRRDAEVALTRFCEVHSSAPGADPLRYAFSFETNAAVLLVQRPGFMNREEWVSSPVAKFRYSEARNEWSLYWPDSSGKWQRVSNVKAAKDVAVLLEAVVKDSLGVFWS